MGAAHAILLRAVDADRMDEAIEYAATAIAADMARYTRQTRKIVGKDVADEGTALILQAMALSIGAVYANAIGDAVKKALAEPPAKDEPPYAISSAAIGYGNPKTDRFN